MVKSLLGLLYRKPDFVFCLYVRTRDFKPLVAEFNKWPRVHLNSSSGTCTFNSSNKKELHKPKIQKPVESSSPDRLAEAIDPPPKIKVHDALPKIDGQLNLTYVTLLRQMYAKSTVQLL